MDDIKDTPFPKEASLGNGVSFMSSIYLTHPQYHDAGVYGGDSGGSGGN